MPAIHRITSARNQLKGRFGNERKGKCTGGTGTIGYKYKEDTQTVPFEDTLTADCGGKSLRLRSNESPSGAFEQQNGLAQARWRGLAPTSSDLFSSAGPRASRFICWLFCCNKRPGQGRTLCPGLSARCGGVSPTSCAPRSRPPSCPAGSRRARHPWRSCGRCGAAGAGSCWWP